MTRQYRTSLPPALTPAERMARKAQQKEQRMAKKPVVQKYGGLVYDYAQIPDDALRERVQAAAVEIKKHQRRAALDLIEIGLYLNEVKALMPHGKFGEWIDTEFGYGPRMAQEFMAVARRFSPDGEHIDFIPGDAAASVLIRLHGGKYEFNSYLEPTVIRLLAHKSVPDSAIEEVLAITQTQEMKVSVAQAKAIISEHKATQPPKPPKVVRPKQLPPPEPEPTAITAEYQIVPSNPATRSPQEIAAELSLSECLMVLEVAKEAAKRARELEPDLYNAVTDMLPSISRLIHKLEGILR